MEASAYDLVRLGNRLTDGTILNTASLDLLWTPPDGLCSYAFGWNVGSQMGHRTVGKDGGQLGAASYIRIYPDDDIVIVLLSNMQVGDPSSLTRTIGGMILSAMSSGTAPASVGAVTQEVVEPDSEAIPAEDVVWPVSNPQRGPTPEELQESPSESTSFFMPIYLPLVLKAPVALNPWRPVRIAGKKWPMMFLALHFLILGAY